MRDQGPLHSKSEQTKCEAPGQFLRHYSPDLVSFLYDGTYNNQKHLRLEDAVLLDFSQANSAAKDQVKYYRDLSEQGDCVEAVHVVYDFLRWAETKTDCTHVLLPSLSCIKSHASNCEHMEALFDRLYRAASGKSA